MIIGIVGHAGSGKDTVGKMITESVPAVCLSLADPLKKFCAEVFDWPTAALWGPSENRNTPDCRYPRGASAPGPEYLTPRYALQTLGTEWGRNCYEHVWIDLGIRRAQKLLQDVREVTEACPDCGKPETVKVKRYAAVVITDCRFVNEASRVRAAGGEVWRVLRPGASGAIAGGAAGHRSEVEQDSPDMEALVSRTIYNGGTLEDLRLFVEHTLQEAIKNARR